MDHPPPSSPRRNGLSPILHKLAADLEAFDMALKASGSATATLVAWMQARGGDREGTLSARVREDVLQSIPNRLKERLKVDSPFQISYRRVWLILKGRILSHAENWYVPERLTDEMRAILAGGTIPFGKVVEPLTPTRETFSSERLWYPIPGDEASSRLPAKLLHHHALVRTPGGEPICEVSEYYTRNILL